LLELLKSWLRSEERLLLVSWLSLLLERLLPLLPMIVRIEAVFILGAGHGPSARTQRRRQP
jgi:hypothetical protein